MDTRYMSAYFTFLGITLDNIFYVLNAVWNLYNKAIILGSGIRMRGTSLWTLRIYKTNMQKAKQDSWMSYCKRLR